MMMRVLSYGCVLGVISAGAAMAQQACEPYTVRSGDSLREIAQRAYSNANYQIIFNANRQVIGSNPNSIEIGDVLQLPCADGTLRPTSAAPAPPAQPTAAVVQSTGNAPAGYRPTIKFLTGGNYAPFTDEDLPGRGLFTELVDTAMLRAASDREFSITFVNDWGSHLGDLLPINAFDLGFPWFKPDCTKVDLLSPSMAQRCTDFNFSEPFYEVVITTYALKGSRFAGASQPSDLLGARICRPEGYYTFDLEQEGLSPPAIDLVQPVLPKDCFEEMIAGTVDVVPMELDLSEGVISELQIEQQIVELPSLAQILTFHVVTHKSNPYGRTYLTLLNQGLQEMRGSGEWFGIVSTQLAEFAKSNQ